jgi:hypothetical protein
MPLFLFETLPITEAQRDEAVRLAAWRFPEVSFEQGYVHHDGGGQHLWLCRAPNEDCVSRWVAAAGLDARGLCHVQTVDLHGGGSRSTKEPSDDPCR